MIPVFKHEVLAVGYAFLLSCEIGCGPVATVCQWEADVAPVVSQPLTREEEIANKLLAPLAPLGIEHLLAGFVWRTFF